MPVLSPVQQTVIAAASGLITGAASCYLTRLLVSNRYREAYSVWYINKPYTPFLWAIFFAALHCFSTLYMGLTEALVLMAMLIPLTAIAATDAKIRKIPNSMLLVLLTEIIFFVAYRKITGEAEMMLGQRFMATVISLVVFTIPSMFKLSVGWGDVKLAGVLAIWFMLLSFCQIVAIMGVGFAVAAIILYATKKGDIKTALPMGPFLALGAVITLLFPVF